MSQSKYGPPCQKGDLVDVGKYKKLAQRVEETLTQMCLFAEPKQLDPSLVLVAPMNRSGAPPNKRHVHFGVLKSFKDKGFDRNRPQVGICIMFTSACSTVFCQLALGCGPRSAVKLLGQAPP